MILLTGTPHIGKSTAIRKIITCLGPKNCEGFWTQEIREKDAVNRTGFRINTLDGKTGILASVNSESELRVSRYGVNIDEFEKLCLPTLENSSENKYLIIDEIGPMQLFSESYKKILMELCETDKKIIGSVFFASHPWLDEFKKQKGIELYKLDEENRDHLWFDIVQKATANDTQMQSKIKKAIKYSQTPDIFAKEKDKIIIQSEHGTRTIKNLDDPVCSCDFFKEQETCSHIMASVLKGLIANS